MTIALFDKFLNTLPQAVLEAKDISMVIMIDPPEGLPPPLLAGRGILSTEAKTIEVYNAEGSAVAHTFDISGTDLKPITEELEAVKATANAADTLSKNNKQRLDAIDLSKYAELDKDVQFNVLNLTSKLNLTDPNGSEVNFTDALKFNNSGFTKLSILNGSIDVNTQLSMGGTHQIINLASGGDNDTNAATIGDAKRISTEGSGLKPTEGEWDMLTLPVTNVATSEVETSAATVGQVKSVESKADAAQTTATAADTLSKANEEKINNLPAPPDLTNYIQNGDDAELTSVSFTEDSSIHFRPESGLILESDSLCGEDTSGNKTFIIKDGEFDLKTKVITNVSDGVADTDAVTKGQLNAVEGKVDANTSSISGVKSTADAADALSKSNKSTLDALPPDPTPRVAALETNALQKNESGFDAKSFKILNVDSGEDVDTSVANIGDVKRIATEGSGLKPTDNEWDMLNLPIINVAQSEETTSAATVGQVNAVEGKADAAKSVADSAKSKADTNEGNINSLTETVSGNTTTIGQVKSTADAADTLSKDNKTRLDNLPPPPDLDGYVKNGEDVNFGTAEINILKVEKGDDKSKFSEILIDGNTNTQMNFVGDTHFYIRNKEDNSKGLEAFQIDNSARFVAKQKIKTPIITNLSTGTTNSNTDKASFVDLSNDNQVNIGAKGNISFSVDGNKSLIVNNDNATFKVDYATGVGMRSEESREATDVVNWETLQGFNPNLSEYAKLNTDVNFNTVTGDRYNFKGTTAYLRHNGNAIENHADEHFWYDHASVLLGKFSTSGFQPSYDIAFNSNEGRKITHNHNLDVEIGGVGNVAFKQSGMKLLRDVDGNNHTLDNMGDIKLNSGYQIEGGATGNLKVRNAEGFYKNNSTDNNSIRFEGDDLRHKAAHHMFFKNASDSQIFGVSDAGANLFNHNIIKVKHILGNSVGSMNVAGVKVIKRNDDNDTSHSIQFNAGDLTYFSDKHEFKTNGNARRLTIENHKADWHDCQLNNVADAEEDKDVPNLKQVQDLIAESGGGGGNDFKVYKESKGGQYYAHNGDSHMWLNYTGSGSEVQLDTMRNGSDQQNDRVGLENNGTHSVIVRMSFNGTSVNSTATVPINHTLLGWASRDLGRWVFTVVPTKEATVEQKVVTQEDLSWSTSSDPRTNSQRMVGAMPTNSVMVGWHNKGGDLKYQIISLGNSKNPETENCVFHIAKRGSTYATGMSTTQGGKGKVYSRIFDGTRGIWNTNSSADTFSLASDIDLEGMPEGEIFLTGDQGILESYISNEETGEIAIRPITGYNVPKHESDIAALEIQTEKNRSVTHYFINEGSLSYDYPDSERKPLVEVQVLNTMQKINDSSVTVTDNAEHVYGGEYNTVGSLAINSSGNWANQYVYHNAYKHVSEDYYVVFNQGNTSWQIIQAENPHTSIGSKAAAVTVQLGGKSSLPESFGDYVIDPNFDNIDSLEFITAEVPVQYDETTSRVLINFNGAKPSGYVILK